MGVIVEPNAPAALLKRYDESVLHQYLRLKFKTYVKTAEHLCRIPVGLYSPFIVYPNAKKNVIMNFAVTPETSFAVVNRPSSLLKCMKTVAMKRTIHWFEFLSLLLRLDNFYGLESFTCTIST